MSKPLIRIHNIETNEIIDREMTNDELAQYEENRKAEAKANAIKIAEAEAKAVAKAALLAQLGITEEQAKLLLS